MKTNQELATTFRATYRLLSNSEEDEGMKTTLRIAAYSLENNTRRTALANIRSLITQENELMAANGDVFARGQVDMAEEVLRIIAAK